MTNEDQLRTALHDRLGPLLADLQPAPLLLDDLASRRRRRTYREAVIAAAAVVAIAGVAVFVVQRPFRDNSAVVTPAPTASSQTGAPLPGPTVSRRDTIRVPDVVGLDLSAAITIAKAAGLEVALSAGPSGAVVAAQTPTAGSIVVPGSVVKLILGPTPTATAGAVLPDGSRLPAECALPSTQGTVPSPDDSFLATDGCATGQFSLATGRALRYLSASGVDSASVNAAGDVHLVLSTDGCDGMHVWEFAARDGSVRMIEDGATPTNRPMTISDSTTAWAWAATTCAMNETTPNVVIRNANARVLTWGHSPGTVRVRSLALANDGKMALSFERFPGTGCVESPNGGCTIASQGISIVAPQQTVIPEPQIVPSAHCEFDATVWSGAALVAFEWCDGPRGWRGDYPGTRRLVRLDAQTGARLSVVDVPQTAFEDGIEGMRALSNGDVLLAMGSAKMMPHLLRLHGESLSAIHPNGCGQCIEWGGIFP